MPALYPLFSGTTIKKRNIFAASLGLDTQEIYVYFAGISFFEGRDKNMLIDVREKMEIFVSKTFQANSNMFYLYNIQIVFFTGKPISLTIHKYMAASLRDHVLIGL